MSRTLRGWAFGMWAVAAGSLGLGGCAMEATEDDETLGTAEQAVSVPKKAFCTVDVAGRGRKDMETDYIPNVITCENGGANLQALKAQAIAARSVAYYSLARGQSICDSQGCQVYSCGRGPSATAKRAAKETAGQILSYGGMLTYAFYVAGDSGASPPSCRDNGGYTSHYVTYNAGRTGKNVIQTSLGFKGPPGFGQNRGCMSQWGARCLENKKGYDFMKILRFYYGSDIKVIQTQGPCVQNKTLKAKATRKWSNAKRYRGKKADYIACAEKPFNMAFTFKNRGSARWRDVKGRGDGIGSDVFLVTADGKKDKLTGKKRFSVKKNKNSMVRGDRKAKNCSSKNGCRKTTFIEGGIRARAPKKPGIYKSRWRLRDYSKAWSNKSHGFGPKVELKVKVVSCTPSNPDACGCRVWCTDGSKHKVTAQVDSDKSCKAIAETVCKPAGYLSHAFKACPAPVPPAPPPATEPTAPGSSTQSSMEEEPEAWTSEEPESEEPAAEVEGDADPAADDEADPNSLLTDDSAEEDPALDEADEEEDDSDFVDDGFDGDEEGIATTKSEPASTSGGCSLARPVGAPLQGSALALAAFAGLAVLRRRRQRS
jgi:hypothetical protein